MKDDLTYRGPITTNTICGQCVPRFRLSHAPEVEDQDARRVSVPLEAPRGAAQMRRSPAYDPRFPSHPTHKRSVSTKACDVETDDSKRRHGFPVSERGCGRLVRKGAGRYSRQDPDRLYLAGWSAVRQPRRYGARSRANSMYIGVRGRPHVAIPCYSAGIGLPAAGAAPYTIRIGK